MNKISLKKVASVTGLFLGAFALSVLAANWTPADCAAPGCNVDAPINVSNSQQTKIGTLILQDRLSVGKDEVPTAGYTLDVDGPGLFTGLAVTGLLNVSKLSISNQLNINTPGSETKGNVLTTDGNGLAEWKPASGSITLSEVKSFSVNVPRNGGIRTTSTAPTPYLFCALSRIHSEMSRVNAGVMSNAYCEVKKNADGTWQVSGNRADDPDYTCEMTCFK